MWRPDVVLYHDPCFDGFGAAVAAWKRWGSDCAYFGIQYGDEPPVVDGKRVLMVDFSLKRDAMEALAARADSIVVLDHHKTAEAELAAFPRLEHLSVDAVEFSDTPPAEPMLGASNVLVYFDMEKSGAVLTWEFCSRAPVPPLLKSIQDRDLWRFEYDSTRAVHMAPQTYDQTFDVWDGLLDRRTELTAVGIPVLQYHNRMLERLSTKARRIWWPTRKEDGAQAYNMSLDGAFPEHEDPAQYIAAVVINAPPVLASDLGHLLVQQYPASADMAIVWSGNMEDVFVSLRSGDGGADVSEVARLWGGGGHRNAAGFKCGRSEFPILC